MLLASSLNQYSWQLDSIDENRQQQNENQNYSFLKHFRGAPNKMLFFELFWGWFRVKC